MTKLNYEDVTRIQSVILSSDYPDDLVERYVDGIESAYEKARAFDEIVNAVDESANSYELVARIKLEVLRYQKLEGEA